MAAYRRIALEVEASWVSRLHSVTDLEPGNDTQVSRSESHAHALRERLRRHRGARANGGRPTPRGETWKPTEHAKEPGGSSGCDGTPRRPRRCVSIAESNLAT